MAVTILRIGQLQGFSYILRCQTRWTYIVGMGSREEVTMSPEDRFNEHYREGTAPWDIGKPDFNLVHAVTTTPISAARHWRSDVELATTRSGFRSGASRWSGLMLP